MDTLNYITIHNYKSNKGRHFSGVKLSYQIFGQHLHTAPVVLVNHALTGNSNVAGENGWWTEIVGNNKAIDTNIFTILAFDIPGNGHQNLEVVNEYDAFTANDIARLFGLAIIELQIDELYAVIGGSLGGGIAWEMTVEYPNLIKNLVAIATDWKATDWIIGHNKVQFQILENSDKPLHDARMMAMLYYRTPASFNQRFGRTLNKEGIYNIESWLLHHGDKLQARFTLHAYKVMTYLLSSVDISKKYKNEQEAFSRIRAKVHVIGINSDLLFVPDENKITVAQLKAIGKDATYTEIDSVHGHDAFLIEFNQLENHLKSVFKVKINNNQLLKRNLV